jgi:hypothetical protein
MRNSAVNGRKNMAKSTTRIPRQIRTRFVIVIRTPLNIECETYPGLMALK